MYGKAFFAEKLFALVIALYVFFLFRYRWRVVTSKTYTKKMRQYEGFKKYLQEWYLNLDKKKMALKIILILIMVFSGYHVYARLNPEKRFHRLIDGCEILVKDKKYAQAVIDMTNALKIRPDYIRGHYFLANIYMGKGEFGRAESALRQVVRLQADYGNAVNMLKSILVSRRDSRELERLARQIAEKMPVQGKIIEALSLMIEDDPDSALTVLEEARELAPNEEKIYQIMGDLQTLAGRTENAVDAYKRAVKLNFGLWQVHNALARLYLEQGLTEDALSELRITRSLNPEFYLPALKLAQIYSNKGYFEGAVNILEDILEKKEGHKEASYTLGIVYAAMGRSQEAINLLKQLPASYQEKRNYGYNLALSYYNTAKYSKAYEWLNVIKESKGLDVAGLKLLARVYSALGQTSESANVLQELVRQSKADSKDRRILAMIEKEGADIKATGARENKKIEIIRSKHTDLEEYLRNKDYDSLIKGALKAIEENEFKAPFYNLLGVAYLASAKPELAKKYFLRSYNEKNDNPMPLLNLTNIYLKTGAAKEAAELLREHNRLFREEHRTRLKLGKIYFKTGRLDQAQEILTNVLAMNPKSFEAHQVLGVISMLKGNTKLAVSEYLQAISLNPNDAVSLNDLANIYAEEQTNLDQALEYAARAVRIVPGSGNFRDTLGWAYYRKGEFLQALSHFEAAYERSPYISVIPYHLGLVQFRLERYSEAQKSLKLALNMKGTLRDADQAKSLLTRISEQLNPSEAGGKSGV